MKKTGNDGNKPTKTSNLIPASILDLLAAPGERKYSPHEKVCLASLEDGEVVARLLVNNHGCGSELDKSDISLVLKRPGWAKYRLARFSYGGFLHWMATHRLGSVHDAGFVAAAYELVSP